jgi:hypothetical protein
MAFALADNLGYDQIYLAGHDFDAIVSWNLAVQHPERLNTPIDWISSQNHGEDGLEQVHYGSSIPFRTVASLPASVQEANVCTPFFMHKENPSCSYILTGGIFFLASCFWSQFNVLAVSSIPNART